MSSLNKRSNLLFTRIAVAKLNGRWPKSQECNGVLHYDWCNDCYYSDFYGESELVQKICTMDEFIKMAIKVEIGLIK